MNAKSLVRILLVVAISAMLAAAASAQPSVEPDIRYFTPVAPVSEEVGASASLRIGEVLPTFYFVDRDRTLCQVVYVRIENLSRGDALGSLRAARPDGEAAIPLELRLPPGETVVRLLLEDRRSPGAVEVALHAWGDLQHRLAFDWEPSRQWKLYVTQMSHFDHGYTGLQCDVMAKRDMILDTVLEYCRLTDDWPDPARFRWTVEASFCMNHYLETHPWTEQEIRDRIAQGRIEIAAKSCHMHASTAGHEQIVRILYNSMIDLSERLGAEVLTAMHTDPVGMTWGAVTAWSGAGVRYFLFNPNLYYRGGNILHKTYAPQAYYWLAPSGDRTLTWRSKDGYGEATCLLEGLDPTVEWTTRKISRLENAGYPYDVVHFTRTGLDQTLLFEAADNCLPLIEFCQTVREWTELYEYPKYIISTPSRFFEYLEANFAGEVPLVRGDCPDWWADGVLTGAVAQGRARRLHHKLAEVEALSCLSSLANPDSPYPASELGEAWEKTTLFDEHTWGYIFPFFPKHQAIWNEKVDRMLEADAICDELTDSAAAQISARIAGDGWMLMVFNALSWDRDDAVSWRPPAGFPKEHLGADAFVLLDPLGEPVPYQRSVSTEGETEIVFIARQVPAMGYTAYRLIPSPTEPAFESALWVEEAAIQSERYRVGFDPAAGIEGILDMGLDRELVDAGARYRVNEFISRNQGLLDLEDRRKRGRIRGFEVREAGPVFASAVYYVVDADNPATWITQEVRVYDGLDRIDFINRVRDFDNSLGQSKYFAFAFDVPDFEFRLDIPNAVMRPFHEQLTEYAKYYAVQHWIDVFSPAEGFGVAWATSEGPMVELGEITKKSGWWAIAAPSYYEPGKYPYDPKFPRIYSEIMNNFQNTNFNYYQQGSGTWRYAVMGHQGTWSQPAVAQFGWDLSSPLLVTLFESDPDGDLPGSLGMIRVQPENVKVLAFKDADRGLGTIVRLFENCGWPTQARITFPLLSGVRVWRTDHVERDIAELPCDQNAVTVDLSPLGLATIRVQGDPALPVDDGESNEEDDEDDGGCGC